MRFDAPAALVVLLALTLTAPARADDAPADAPKTDAARPQTMPSRDVDVTYVITRSTQTMQERTRWSAATGTQRVDPPGRNMHLVLDHKQHKAWMIDDDAHTVMEMTPPKPGPLDPGSDASFTRQGPATVAGVGCTDWETKSGGPDTLLCLTDDGVLLRVQAGGHTLIEATAVTYAPEDGAIFTIPAEYARIAPPMKGWPRVQRPLPAPPPATSVPLQPSAPAAPPGQ